MLWLTKFIQKGGDLKGAIRAFTQMNGRMPRTSEMNKILQTFGDKGSFKGFTPKVIEGGKSEQKMGLGQFTKKEDAYEKASILKDKAKTGLPEFDEILEQEFAKAFKKKKTPVTEQELKVKMEIENKEAAARIRKKKAEEDGNKPR